MMRWFCVKNFDRFQHYRDSERTPIWIKLYVSVLDDYEFSTLDDASKAHLMLIWVLASKHQNRLRLDPKWVQRSVGARQRINLNKLLSLGFLNEINESPPISSRPYIEEEIEVDKEKKEKRTTTDSAEAVVDLSFLRRELKDLGIEPGRIEEVIAKYPATHIIRAIEHARERAEKSPGGMLLRLIENINLGPSQAEKNREATMRNKEISELCEARKLRQLEAEKCEAEESARWQAEVWPALNQSERDCIDRIIEANPFTRNLSPEALMLAREQVWRMNGEKK